MRSIYSKVLGVLALSIAGFAGCKKMDDSYRSFIVGGETVYIGKADSLRVHGGRGRVELSWLLMSDPKVRSYKVYWNNRRDSLSGSVTKTDQVDTVRVQINNLTEGSHQFEVFLYDDKGNSSVKAERIGKVYGDRYEESLLNRAYRNIKRAGADLIITWMPAEETIKEVRLDYLDVNQQLVSHMSAPDSLRDTLRNFPRNAAFTYRSIFKPEATALDEFTTPIESFQEVITEGVLDKGTFKHYPLPGDTHKGEFATWGVENTWDGNPDKIFYVDPKIVGLALPNWFTVDLGNLANLTKVRVNQLSYDPYWMFNVGAPKTFEIYGSNAPASDGSWESWTLLGSFESMKPSGLPIGQVSEEDKALAKAGELFNFPQTDQYYRYVRFKTKSTWGGNLNVMIGEVTFTGYQ